MSFSLLSRRRPRLAHQGWVWLTPVVLFILVWIEAGHLAAIVAALVGAGFLYLVQHRVSTAASVLLVLILFNLVLLSLAFRLGLSVSMVKALAYWKEGMIIGCFIGLWHRRPLRHLDALDIAVLAYIALGAAYLIAPQLFIGNAGGSHLSFYTRVAEWKIDVLDVAVFIIFRHLRLGRDAINKILERVLLVVIAFALIGIFEAAFPNTWNHFAVTDLGVPRYEHLAVGYQPSSSFSLSNVGDFSILNGHRSIRVGSVLFNNLTVGFVFAIGLGTATEIVARGRARWWVYASLPVVGSALLLTQTRSSIIAGVIAVLVALRHRAGKSLGRRTHLAQVLGVLAVVVLPLVFATGTLGRFLSAPQSNTAHQNAFVQGVDVMKDYPMGRGLGTAAGGGQKSVAQPAQLSSGPQILVTESQYLQIGTQFGIAGLGLYVAILALMVRRLLLRKRDDPLALSPAAMSNVAVGAVIGLLFTQAFVDFEVAVLFFGLAGLAVSVVDDRLDAIATSDPVPSGTSMSSGTTTMRPTPTS